MGDTSGYSLVLFGFAFDHSIKKAKSICHRFCLRTDPRSGLLSRSCGFTVLWLTPFLP